MDRRYEWDPAKAEANAKKHGVAFQAAWDFDWETSVVEFDAIHSGSERRWKAIGLIEGRLHVMVFTVRGPKIRLISLRIANRKERWAHGEVEEAGLD